MVAHAHDTGKLYYAHAGAWVAVASEASVSALGVNYQFSVAADDSTQRVIGTDEVIMFTPLGKHQIENIVKLQLHLLGERLSKSEIELVVTPDALSYLAAKGFDPQYGARPVKRTIQKEVMNELSKYILSGKIDKSEAVVLDVFDGQIVFRKKIDDEALIEL
jgi:hypothetical protein